MIDQTTGYETPDQCKQTQRTQAGLPQSTIGQACVAIVHRRAKQLQSGRPRAVLDGQVAQVRNGRFGEVRSIVSTGQGSDPLLEDVRVDHRLSKVGRLWRAPCQQVHFYPDLI